jgi:hypothetical protein
MRAISSGFVIMVGAIAALINFRSRHFRIARQRYELWANHITLRECQAGDARLALRIASDERGKISSPDQCGGAERRSAHSLNNSTFLLHTFDDRVRTDCLARSAGRLDI